MSKANNYRWLAAIRPFDGIYEPLGLPQYITQFKGVWKEEDATAAELMAALPEQARPLVKWFELIAQCKGCQVVVRRMAVDGTTLPES
jgi:hypothetical protein